MTGSTRENLQLNPRIQLENLAIIRKEGFLWLKIDRKMNILLLTCGFTKEHCRSDFKTQKTTRMSAFKSPSEKHVNIPF